MLLEVYVGEAGGVSEFKCEYLDGDGGRSGSIPSEGWEVERRLRERRVLSSACSSPGLS